MANIAQTLEGEPLPKETVKALQRWHLAREAAKRYNRNLLQYAAGLAAIIGIIAGTSSLQLVARSLDSSIVTSWRLRSWRLDDLIVSASVLFALILLVLVFVSFFQRLAADRRADHRLGELITLMPNWFQPRDD